MAALEGIHKGYRGDRSVKRSWRERKDTRSTWVWLTLILTDCYLWRAAFNFISFFHMRKRVKKLGTFKTFAFDCLPSLFNEIEVWEAGFPRKVVPKQFGLNCSLSPWRLNFRHENMPQTYVVICQTTFFLSSMMFQQINFKLVLSESFYCWNISMCKVQHF